LIQQVRTILANISNFLAAILTLDVGTKKSAMAAKQTNFAQVVALAYLLVVISSY